MACRAELENIRRAPRRLSRASRFLAGLAAISPLTAHAAWPERPVRLIVPVAAGGPTDDLARTVANGLGDAIGGSFVVENRGGGGSRIGIGAVARAEPDGYTLLVAASSLPISVVMSAATPYDPIKDFAPIALIATTPSAFSISTKLGIADLAALVAESKRDGVSLNYATPGTGTVGHLAVELFKLRAGLKIAHVAHTGAGPAVLSLLSGAVQLISTPVPAVQKQIEGGAVKALSVTSERRWPKLPDVPTMVELGHKGFVAETFFGLLAPAATPRDILDKLTTTTIAVLRKPETTERLLQLGYEVAAKGPEVLGKRIADDLALWRGVAQQAGLIAK